MIKQISDELYVFTRQLELADLSQIEQLGIKTIICNRPDEELINQASFDQIKLTAQKMGIETHYLPISKMGIDEQNISAMATIINQAKNNNKAPLLAYCRTGTRSTRVYFLSQLSQLDDNQIRNLYLSASKAGYDLSDLIG